MESIRLKSNSKVLRMLYIVLPVLFSGLFYIFAVMKSSRSTDIVLGIVWIFLISFIVAASIIPKLAGRK